MTVANSEFSTDRAFWAVVPAGGSGTRLWPLSRSGQPKFLLPLVNDTSSLLQETVTRLSPLTDPSHILIVSGPAHAVQVADQLPLLATDQIIVEPSPRGTGPAIALAAAIIARQDPDAVMGSFAADHDVRDTDAFVKAVRTAIDVANEGMLVTIGIQPTRAETGYGYIERREDVLLHTHDHDAYAVRQFIEKPDAETAQHFVDSGLFDWNASMFIWRVDVFLEELQRYLPDVAEGVKRIAAVWDSPDLGPVLGEVWPTMRNVTIDNGIMELSDRIAVVPANMGWSDVGDWHGLGSLLAQDAHGNVAHGDVLDDDDCSDNVVWSDTTRVISLVGLNNIIVVDTPDALLVADRSRAQSVRSTVERLKQQNRLNLV